MQPENDIQAVRRVLARAGITAAALTLTMGAAAPAAFASHGTGKSHAGRTASAGHDQRDQAKQSDSSDEGGSTQGGSDEGGSSQGDSDEGGSSQGGSAGQSHGQNGEHGNSGDHGTGGSTSGEHNPAGNNGTV